MKLHVFIEGGGSTRAEQQPLRKAFSELFAKVRPTAKASTEACGGRATALRDFQTALSQKKDGSTRFLLLVDSEGPVEKGPWEHVAERQGDGWKRPPGARDADLHFMVQMMESWIVADAEALEAFYGSKLNRSKLPKRADLETAPKAELITALETATKDVKTKGSYEKSHAFSIIGTLDPAKIRKACPTFAERFFNELEKVT